MNILITGATGFIGQNLVQRLQQDQHTITVLSRNSSKASELLNVPALEWDYATQDVPAEALHDCQIIINLMG
ncbi:MAG: NAD-dependent epimerase/dehydratase family protein, partial [Nitrosomonadaceae bacterium]|nr:NAD-dependent epimerase/dehydratase family protein [Nitrosomonadaceae bacterium]